MSRRVILWCLLAGTVMAASSHPALSQEKPPTTRATPSIDASTVIISVPKDGEFYFGKDRITLAEIPDRLKAAFKDEPPEGRAVYIKAGLDVSYKTVVSVIDTIRGAGISQIGLVTDAASGSKPQAKSSTGDAGKGKKVRARRRTHRRASK